MGKLEDFMARGTVSMANGKKPMRELQVNMLSGEVRDELEHVEPYGFSSEPLTDGLPEAFALFFDGDRSHGIVFCVADRRYRLKPLKPGEVAIYDDLGQKIHLTRSGIEVFTPKNLTATVEGNVTEAVSGSLTAKVTGAVTIKAASVKVDAPTVQITGSLAVTGDVTAGGISLKSHSHPGDSGGTTGGPQ